MKPKINFDLIIHSQQSLSKRMYMTHVFSSTSLKKNLEPTEG